MRRVGEESEQDWGREQNGGMGADVVRLVLAEHLVRRLQVIEKKVRISGRGRGRHWLSRTYQAERNSDPKRRRTAVICGHGRWWELEEGAGRTGRDEDDGEF